RGRPATGGDHRGAGRIRRRRGIQGRTRRAPSPGAVPDRPRPPRRLGDGGGGDQRTGTGGRVTARLYGVGLGPGDPELITGKAARLIEDADVVAYHSGTHGRSIARGIADAAGLMHPDVVEEALVYPVTTGNT